MTKKLGDAALDGVVMVYVGRQMWLYGHARLVIGLFVVGWGLNLLQAWVEKRRYS